MDFDHQRGAVNQTRWWFRKPSWLTITNGQWLMGSIAAFVMFLAITLVSETLFQMLIGFYFAGKAFDHWVKLVKDHEQ